MKNFVLALLFSGLISTHSRATDGSNYFSPIMSTSASHLAGNSSYRPMGSFKDHDPFKIGFYFQPLGIVQFGPIIGLTTTVNTNFIFEGYARLAGYGLLMYVSHIDNDGDLPEKVEGMGYGFGFKYLFRREKGGFYLGPFVDFHHSLAKFNIGDDDWEWYSENRSLVLMANGGYKFISSSGFFVQTGLFLGTAIPTYSEWWYTNPEKDTKKPNDTNVKPFGFLEVTIGIEF